MIAVGCTTANQDFSNSEDSKLKVFTTLYPFQYAVERIGGNAVTTKTVYPPGANAHTYRPDSKEMTEIADSDAFVYMGENMEGFTESMADALANRDVKLIEIGKHEELFLKNGDQHSHEEEQDAHFHEHEAIHDESEKHKDGEEKSDHADHSHHHHHGDKDPHIWLDPVRMIEVAEIIKKNLIDLQPESKEIFTQNFEELKKDLLALDNQFTRTLKDNAHKEILVSHAAYGYWEERYGIEQIAISGLSPSEEPSQKELAHIVDTAKKHNLEYVIFEQNVTNKISKIIQEQINAEALQIHNLSVLTDDDIKQNKDYVSIMKHNLHVLEKATNTQKSEDHHEHQHSHDNEASQIYEGYFEDSQVKDRKLSDWAGNWQSVYPYVQDGTLDEVFKHKAEHEGEMTTEEYKDYYIKGYQTKVDRIVIQGDTVTFYKNGEGYSSQYVYDGYEILTYKAGNRGIRYIFKRSKGAEEAPKYIQFSDHHITPTKVSHYHLYWGDDREALLNELTNWPTYYPSEMTGHEIAHEMIKH